MPGISIDDEQGKATHGEVRKRNRTAALQRVLAGGGTATRAGIARSTGLTSATVSSILSELIEDGLVIEGSLAESTGGKRATTLRIDDRHHQLLSVMISPGLIRAAFVNLLGEVSHTVSARPSGAPTVADVQRLVRRMIDDAPEPPLAIGVKLPGIIEGPLVRWSVQLGWTDVNLARALGEVAAIPAYLINDADAEALAEFSASADSDATQLYVSLSTGVGASFIVSGQLMRGAANRVGEIGHVPVVFGADAPLCPCGSRGCLEELVSVTSLLGLPHGADLESVDLLAEARRPENDERLANGARTLARTLLMISAAMDVPSVVVGGYAPELGPEFLGHLRSEAARYSVTGAMPLNIHYATRAGTLPFRGAAQHAMTSSLGIAWAA
ncbi:MAG TPA: ROK family transcriptional regulator [Microbacteriaceae bacterium]